MALTPFARRQHRRRAELFVGCVSVVVSAHLMKPLENLKLTSHEKTLQRSVAIEIRDSGVCSGLHFKELYENIQVAACKLGELECPSDRPCWPGCRNRRPPQTATFTRGGSFLSTRWSLGSGHRCRAGSWVAEAAPRSFPGEGGAIFRARPHPQLCAWPCVPFAGLYLPKRPRAGPTPG